LEEQPNLSSSAVWADVRKSISSDPRYDAVGSSTLRQELFDTHIKKLASSSTVAETPKEAAERKVRERKAKEEASLRERQARVQQEQEKVSLEANKSRAGASREEGERLFGSLLVDQVRSHDVSASFSQEKLERRLLFRCHGTMLSSSCRVTHASITHRSIRTTSADSLKSVYSTSAASAPMISTNCSELMPHH
jgi:transcription elongation regulator 1